MISGLYSAATGMDAAATRHETSAENLAHAHLPGFRRRVLHQTTFGTVLEAQRNGHATVMERPERAAGGLQTRRIAIDFTHGPLKASGRSLDVAIESDGFFVVDGPDGPMYTRNGSFQAHPDGQLVTIDGLTVSGGNGPIQIPPNTSADAISISRDGRLSANGVEFGQLQFVEVSNPEQLIATGASLFKAGPNADVQEAEGSVLQGFVESANVAQMDELVNILVASRQYEMSQKALKTIDEAVGRRINGK